MWSEDLGTSCTLPRTQNSALGDKAICGWHIDVEGDNDKRLQRSLRSEIGRRHKAYIPQTGVVI